MTEFMKPRGRKLVSGGDPDFEIAAEVRQFEALLDNGTTKSLTCAVVRVWCQRHQTFTTLAISSAGRIVAESRKPTYKETLTELRTQIEH